MENQKAALTEVTAVVVVVIEDFVAMHLPVAVVAVAVDTVVTVALVKTVDIAVMHLQAAVAVIAQEEVLVVTVMKAPQGQADSNLVA